MLSAILVPVNSEGQISIQQKFTADLNNKLSLAYLNFTREFSKAVSVLNCGYRYTLLLYNTSSVAMCEW